MLTIVDAKNMGMSSLLNKPLMQWMKKTSAMYADHYPEKSYKILVINAPFTFYALWRIIRPMLDAVTAEKVEIVRTGKINVQGLECGVDIVHHDCFSTVVLKN